MALLLKGEELRLLEGFLYKRVQAQKKAIHNNTRGANAARLNFVEALYAQIYNERVSQEAEEKRKADLLATMRHAARNSEGRR